MRSKREYLGKMRWRYRRAKGRGYKSRLIEELVAVCGYSRKHAISLLNGRGGPRVLKRTGPKPTYQEEVSVVLKRLRFASDQLCGKRLKAALPHWLPHYQREYGALSELLQEKLKAISAATIDRLLAPVRAKTRPKGRGGTKPGRWLKNQIPLQTDQWDERRPGFMEADTVAHCGDTLEGDFIWSLCFTDLATGWTELRAIWNKGAYGVMEAVGETEAKLPFALLGFDCDNGSEFLNHHLWRYCPAQRARALHPLAALSQKRQRTRGTEELDPCTVSARLRAAGKSGVVETDQRPVSRRLAALSQLLLSLGQVEGKTP